MVVIVVRGVRVKTDVRNSLIMKVHIRYWACGGGNGALHFRGRAWRNSFFACRNDLGSVLNGLGTRLNGFGGRRNDLGTHGTGSGTHRNRSGRLRGGSGSRIAAAETRARSPTARRTLNN